MALVILAHSDYSKSVANKAIIEYLKLNCENLEIRNLIELYPSYKIDVDDEQEALLRHQQIIFQYPLYWYNMPAILKQYFDSVLTHGFAYGKDTHLLEGKLFIPSITIGAPKEDYRANGDAHFRVNEFCKNLEQTAYYTKMIYIDPLYFHGTSPVLFTQQEIEQKAKIYAKDLAAFIQKLQNQDQIE